MTTIVDYSKFSIAVFGNTKPIKEQLQTLGGKFNANLTYGETKKAGWIFSNKKRTEIEELLNSEEIKAKIAETPEEKDTRIVNNKPAYIVDYSKFSIAVLGDTKPIKDGLLALAGKFNSNLTYEDSKQSGWIFSNKKRLEIETFLAGSK